MFINKKSKIKLYPFPNSKILLIDDFLKKKNYESILEEINLIEIEGQSIKNFNLKGKSKKKEFSNFSEYYFNQKKLIKELSSKSFLTFLRKNLDLKFPIFPDKTNMFSGFNIVSKGGFLRPHADFNFNNSLKKYRSINLLIYFNKKWKKSYGGNLSFYSNKNFKKKYEFIAKENRALIFLTNKETIHGYKKVNVKKKRLSLNFYYYTKENISLSEEPHKTIWR